MVKTKNPIAMKDADKEDAILIADHPRRQSVSEPWQQPDARVDDLPGKVQDLLTNKLDKTVYIKADMRAKYETVEDVVDNLRAAGVDQLGLLTEQIDPTQDDAGAGQRTKLSNSDFVKGEGEFFMAMAVGGRAAVRRPTST